MAEVGLAKQVIPNRFKTFRAFLGMLANRRRLYQSEGKRLVGSKQWYKNVKPEIERWNRIFLAEFGHELILFTPRPKGRRSNEYLCELHPRVRDIFERSPDYFLVMIARGEQH